MTQRAHLLPFSIQQKWRIQSWACSANLCKQIRQTTEKPAHNYRGKSSSCHSSLTSMLSMCSGASAVPILWEDGLQPSEVGKQTKQCHSRGGELQLARRISVGVFQEHSTHFKQSDPMWLPSFFPLERLKKNQGVEFERDECSPDWEGACASCRGVLVCWCVGVSCRQMPLGHLALLVCIQTDICHLLLKTETLCLFCVVRVFG